MKTQLEARNLEQKRRGREGRLQARRPDLPVLRQASEAGQLYGSVSTRDIAALVTDSGFSVNRNQIQLNAPIKMIGTAQGPGRAASRGRGHGHAQCRAQCRRGGAARARRGRDGAARGRRRGGGSGRSQAAAEAFFEQPEAAAEARRGEGEQRSRPSKVRGAAGRASVAATATDRRTPAGGGACGAVRRSCGASGGVRQPAAWRRPRRSAPAAASPARGASCGLRRFGSSAPARPAAPPPAACARSWLARLRRPLRLGAAGCAGRCLGLGAAVCLGLRASSFPSSGRRRAVGRRRQIGRQRRSAEPGCGVVLAQETRQRSRLFLASPWGAAVARRAVEANSCGPVLPSSRFWPRAPTMQATAATSATARHANSAPRTSAPFASKRAPHVDARSRNHRFRAQWLRRTIRSGASCA